VVAYSGAIEQARANNRQGLPVGAQYLRSASAQLRAEALPIADNLVVANADRAEDRMAVWVGLVFVIVAALALVALVIGQLWLARRFRRTFNRGMLGASVLLLALLVGGIVLLVNLNSSVASIQDGSFAAVNRAAGARIEASNAKSNESLTLIARGSGAAFETAWKNSTASVTDDLTGWARTRRRRVERLPRRAPRDPDAGRRRPVGQAVALGDRDREGLGQHRVQRLRRPAGRDPRPLHRGGRRRACPVDSPAWSSPRILALLAGWRRPAGPLRASPPGSGSTDEHSLGDDPLGPRR
jgi:hypothetical protein